MSYLNNKGKALKNYDKDQALFNNIGAKLSELAEMYGGTDGNIGPALKEAGINIVKFHSNLSLNEITEAVRLWANNVLIVKGAEFYYGRFTARQIGLVLAAYQNMRKNIVAVFTTETAAYKEETAQAARDKEWAAVFEGTMIKNMRKVTEGGGSWESCKDFWYDSALKRGWFEVTNDEKRAAFNLAERYIKNPKSIKGLSIELMPKNQKIVIAKKMIVWEKLLIIIEQSEL